MRKDNFSYFLNFLLFLLCTFVGVPCFSQQYSVQVVVQLHSPYTLNTQEYVTGTEEKLSVVLINTDLQKPLLDVRLRMHIKNGSNSLRSKDYVYYPAISLEAGIAKKISLHDLSPYFNADNLDFNGFDRNEYVRTRTLPEGFYEFCFEAVEYYTGQTVSRSACSMAFMSYSDPPLLNLPRKGDIISTPSSGVQNILFNWTPRNMSDPNSAFNTEYIFSLHELNDPGISPEAGLNSTPPLYTETVRTTTLLYGPDKPLLRQGVRYAWRIQAVSTSPEQSAYRNHGFSEIYYFTYLSLIHI